MRESAPRRVEFAGEKLMRHFLFEEKPYQFRPYFKRRREGRDAAAELARLFRLLAGRRSKRGGALGGGGGGRRVDARQKCVVKMNYSKNIAEHYKQIDYIRREGTDVDGGAARLFGTPPGEYRQNMDKKNYRIFLSPQSCAVDLESLSESFIARLEAQTGHRFYWLGACHYNTAHPHAHLLINGVDKNGKEIEFSRDMVKLFMREAARDICVRQIGNRTPREMELEKERELAAPRWTRLDERVKNCLDNQTFVNFERAGMDKKRMLVRLENLRKLKLCSWENGQYHLKKEWEDDLRANGRYNTFLKAREELRYGDKTRLKLYTGREGAISGRVTRVYKTEEDASDNHAVILEAVDGRSWFVPLFKAPKMSVWNGKNFDKIPLERDALVKIETYKTQSGRLTPVIKKQEAWRLKKEIAKNSLDGELAKEIKRGTLK